VAGTAPATKLASRNGTASQFSPVRRRRSARRCRWHSAIRCPWNVGPASTGYRAEFVRDVSYESRLPGSPHRASGGNDSRRFRHASRIGVLSRLDMQRAGSRSGTASCTHARRQRCGDGPERSGPRALRRTQKNRAIWHTSRMAQAPTLVRRLRRRRIRPARRHWTRTQTPTTARCRW